MLGWNCLVSINLVEPWASQKLVFHSVLDDLEGAGTIIPHPSYIHTLLGLMEVCRSTCTLLNNLQKYFPFNILRKTSLFDIEVLVSIKKRKFSALIIARL